MSVSALCIAVAIALAAYPFVADRVGAWEASRSFTEQQDAFAAVDAQEKEQDIAEASAYNSALAQPGAGAPDGVLPYDALLGGAPDGSICWIEIPRIGVKEPVYRTSGEKDLDAVLMEGAAHVRGTSLPVGGTSANTVITGHTGMRDTRMFDQLDMLVPGDVVILWTLGLPFAYEVTGSELVTPDRSDVMAIRAGTDQCTLVTCRNPPSSDGFLPSGTYTHRLVVHSERTQWDPSRKEDSAEYLANSRTALFGGAAVTAGALLLAFPGLALGCRREWVLDRIVGPTEPACGGACAERRCEGAARLRVGMFGRARFDAFGMQLSGSWTRAHGDRSRIHLELRPKGRFAQRTREAAGFCGIALPEGEFDAVARDGELGLTANDGANVLVFRIEGGDGRAHG